MKRFLILLLALSLILAACQSKPVEVTGQQVSVEGGMYTNVSSDELNSMLKDKDFVFVNVHIPFAGIIANTDLSIPYNQIAEPSYLSQLPADKNAQVVLYCRSGMMSAVSADALVKLGYTNIWNLEGGMASWERAGFEIQNK